MQCRAVYVHITYNIRTESAVEVSGRYSVMQRSRITNTCRWSFNIPSIYVDDFGICIVVMLELTPSC